MLKRLKRHSLWLLALLLAAGIGFYQCLPEQLFNSPYSSIALSREGRLLGAHIASDEQWRFPPVEQVPEKFAVSLIAFEDKRFYQHPGVDPIAVARALYLNISRGHVVSGGSTLSMQVIRLSQQNPPRTLWNKALEAVRALRLETLHSKAEILNLYASHAPFGGNVVGLEAAAWRYFGRGADQLSWAESAMLAVLPNSPGLIHVNRSRNKLKAKRDRLLKKLEEQGVLSELDYTLAVAESLPQRPKDLPRLAPHLLDTMMLEHRRATPDKPPRFNTTLKYSTQRAAMEVAKHQGEALALQEIHNLAMLVIDNKTFEVLAYVGNTPTERADENGQAIDLTQRPRSTGSTLKPFLFANMIQQGEILPETLVSDTPVRYSGYSPNNFSRDFRGAVVARAALASSLNIPAVNMLSYHGVERFLDALRQMGMEHLHRNARDYGLPLVLGGGEGTLWELTGMYANLASLAQQLQPPKALYYQQPVVKKGQATQTKRRSAISPAASWMTLQALLEVARPGNEGYWKSFNSTHKIAWKTGTSFGFRDAWAIGTTPEYTVGVWIGNASGEGRPAMTGVTVAAPVMFEMFNRLPLEVDWFEKPIAQMKTVRLCKDDGFLANDLCDAKDYLIPQDSHFSRSSPNHQRIHIIEEDGQAWRVHSGCESVSRMQTKNWFVLPPDQAFYFRQYHANYQELPPWREDCKNEMLALPDDNPISLIYPRNNTQIYIPKDLGNERSKVVFKAVHRDSEARLFWHLDNTFLGTTQDFHEQAVWIGAGEHVLTLVDEAGHQQEQLFTVLSEDDE